MDIKECKGCFTYNNNAETDCRYYVPDAICPCSTCIVKTMCKTDCELFSTYRVKYIQQKGNSMKSVDLYIIPNYGNWEIIAEFVEQFKGATQIKNPDDPAYGAYDSGFRGCDVSYKMKIEFTNIKKYNVFKKAIEYIETSDDYWFGKE